METVETVPKNELTTTDSVNRKQLVDNWIEQTDFDEVSSVADSTECSSSVVSSTDITPGSSDTKDGQKTSCDSILKSELGNIQNVFNSSQNVRNIGNLQIDHSEGIIIGNVTYITGPIHITQTQGQNTQISNKTTITTNKTPDTKSESERSQVKATPLGEEDSDEEKVNRFDLFIGNIERTFDESVLRIVDRRTWLAQKPLEPYNLLETPVSFVVISHTATEVSLTQAESVYLVRNIQCFHIESRHWNDIAYNFLIGGCGNVYEGRGWTAVGAHTYGYNKKSIGISFVGCFMSELPPSVSLQACKLLIKKGVQLGYISPNYQLIAHCQCSATESPGRKLFDEIKTWPHFTQHPR